MKKILIITCLALVITGCSVKVESIEVPKEKVYIEFGDKHTVNYKIKPDNATNKEVEITSKNGILSNKDDPKEFKVVDNRVYGDDQICITSKENDSIKACYDVYVKPIPFSIKMEELGYTRSGYIYTRVDGQYTTEIDVSQGYLKLISNKDGVYLEYKYYYRTGYGESVQKTGGYTVAWIYKEDTNRATCAASAYYSTFCNYSSESNLINMFSIIKETTKTIIGNYSDEELLT